MHRRLAISGPASARRARRASRRLTAHYARATALLAACRHGHLTKAVRLAARHTMTPAVARANDHYSLKLVCAYGLATADARVCSNYALRSACAGGHLAVARWLVARFGLTAKDAGGCAPQLGLA